MDFDIIGKNKGYFSFTETVANLAQNKNFTKGYQELLETKGLNERTFVWHSLSAIGELVGSTIYENILNYIDNVSNIDTCKVKALYSMSKILGITSPNILDTIAIIPNEVIQLLDIFSINKSFILNPSLVDPKFLITLMAELNKDEDYQEKLSSTLSNAINSLSGISSSDIDVKSVIPEEFYRNFIYRSYFELLSSNICMTYDGRNDNHILPDTEYVIYKDLLEKWDEDHIGNEFQSGTLKSDFFNTIDLDSDYRKTIETTKSLYGLNNFDPFAIADEIYVGNDSLDNYSGSKLYILEMVQKYRNAERYSHDPLTKYAYYSKKHVVRYLKYVNNQYIVGSKNIYNIISSANIYDVDSNYMVLDDILSSEWQNNTVINVDDGTVREEIISSVAEILTDMSFAIADIREKLKTQSQRNYMRGTFLLISYVISEYLKKNLPMQYPELKPILSDYYFAGDGNGKPWNVDIQEYIDTTEYYNLSTDTSQYALNGKTVNLPFWKEDANNFTGMGIALNDIEQFYLDTMNLKDTVSSSMDFLSVIFSLGADRGYIDKRTSSDIIVGVVQDNFEEDVARGKMSQERFDQISSYQRNIFLSYNGNNIAYSPYYNWKNKAHSSYQTHPYLYRFVSYSGISYAIRDIFVNDANKELMFAIHTNEISSILGNCGNILNIWNRNAKDFSGYLSRYESNTHDQATNYGKISPLQHYDGVFYPSAIDEYISALSDKNSFECLIYSVRKGISGREICQKIETNVISDDFPNPDSLSSILSDYNNYVLDVDKLIFDLSTAIENEDSDDVINDLSSQLKKLKSDGPIPTYYENWYSHLHLQHEDLETIANQLSLYSDRISDLYNPTDISSETYDVYKYGLDKYNNSWILYKKYCLSSTNSEKMNTKGELWFRFNSHPIGFPMFASLSDSITSSLNVAKTEDMNRFLYNTLLSWPSDQPFSCIYDIDFTANYETAIIACDPNNVANSYGKVGTFIAVSPYDNPYKYSDDGTFRQIQFYQLKQYNSSISGYVKEDYLSDYVFQGFFQDGSLIQGLWIKVSEDTNLIDIARIYFPSEKSTTNVTFASYASNTNSKIQCLGLTSRIPNNTPIRLGYANDVYTLALITELSDTTNINDGLYGMTYVGYNTHMTSADTELDSIKNRTYGRCRYENNAENIDNEYNSFDRLSNYLTLANFTKGNFSGIADRNSITPKNYNLNPDASYIPLYCGLLGFSRTWAVEYYKNKLLQSVELLGYSYNEFQTKVEDFRKNILVTDDGISSNVDVSEILNSTFRVYEQYTPNRTFMNISYNDILSAEKISNNSELNPDGTTIDDRYGYVWDINLSNLLINSDLSGSYKVILYNIIKGAQCPLIAADLSNLSWTYLSSGTYADRFYMDNRYIFPFIEEVVGTPNVFANEFNPNFASGKSNYIMNVKDLSAGTYFDSDGYLHLKIIFDVDQISNDFIIDRNSLVMFTYHENLAEFENYHFMTPHNVWPELSVNNNVYSEEEKWRQIEIGGEKKILTTSSDYETFLNKSTVSSISAIVLSNFTRWDQIPAISSGTYVFKINEQASDSLAYPGGQMRDELDKIFKTISTQTNELSNVFSVSNTYILELDKPKDFADLIGQVKLGIYSDGEQSERAYEDYISSMYSVSKYKAESLEYLHFYEDNLSVDENTKETYVIRYDDEISDYVIVDSLSNIVSPDMEISDVLSLDALSGISYKIDDVAVAEEASYFVKYTVTEKDIEDFLKIYVNYRFNYDSNEIELYFNYNNYFCTPYSYRNKFGEYAPIYKEGTFLHLNSGESGLLNIIVQLKYFNHNGVVCAIKDMPIATYRIRNVSDDKPKFVIYRTWILTPETVQSFKNPEIKDESAILIVDNVVLQPYSIVEKRNGTAPLSSLLNEDYTLTEDIIVKGHFYANSESTELGNVNYMIVYEYSNDEIAIDFSRTSGGNFSVGKNGSINVRNNGQDFYLGIIVKKWTAIDDTTASYYIPFDAVDFKATNSSGEVIRNVSISQGGIQLNFGRTADSYKFLKKEGKPNFPGFILGENDKVIRMYTSEQRQ